MDDLIIKKAKEDRMARNSKRITLTVLWSGLGIMILNGTIGLTLIGECIVIGGANKVTKWMIKNRKRLVNDIGKNQ
jgi:hypothetical protein